MLETENNVGYFLRHCLVSVKTETTKKLLYVTVPKQQGPVVQSIVSLMSSLGGKFVKCFMTLFLTNTGVFLLKK